MSHILPDLESGNQINRRWFVLIRFLSWKIDISWGVISLVCVCLVCDTDIRVGCCGTRTTWGRRG